jgi:hypothetical protein
MECNREEAWTTFGAGLSEGALFCEARTNLPEASAARFPLSRSQGPIVEEFSRRAFPKRSAHALPGISWSLQSSNRPTSRSAFPRRNRPSRAPAESPKCAREWGLFVPAPCGLIFSKTSTGAPSCLSWMMWISLASWKSSAPKLRKHPALPLRIASGPGASRFGLA